MPHSNIPFATIVNKTRLKRIAFHIGHEYTKNIKEYLYNGALSATIISIRLDKLIWQ